MVWFLTPLQVYVGFCDIAGIGWGRFSLRIGRHAVLIGIRGIIQWMQCPGIVADVLGEWVETHCFEAQWRWWAQIHLQGCWRSHGMWRSPASYGLHEGRGDRFGSGQMCLQNHILLVDGLDDVGVCSQMSFVILNTRVPCSLQAKIIHSLLGRLSEGFPDVPKSFIVVGALRIRHKTDSEGKWKHWVHLLPDMFKSQQFAFLTCQYLHHRTIYCDNARWSRNSILG